MPPQGVGGAIPGDKVCMERADGTDKWIHVSLPAVVPALPAFWEQTKRPMALTRPGGCFPRRG